MRKTASTKTPSHTAKSVVKKIVVPNAPKIETASTKSPAKGFYRAIGRRKEATARVRMMETGNGSITVNGRSFEKYFPLVIMRDDIIAPLKLVGQFDNHDYSIKVEGGGTQGQAGAVRHGMARVLLQWNVEFRPSLKKAGFLKRDPRAKERKKFGLKGARRAPQWAKR
ncbi:MAG: 30S ribosomal protein S9 [Candidatus Magasanikbacteria bacterium]|nr:30S ribosomal protein S9 [Candidatus Magasanikbacteria bacterium]